MRVVWISAGLCLALLVGFFGFFNPAADQKQSVADNAPVMTGNPFAEDEIAARNNENKDVTLAALSQGGEVATGEISGTAGEPGALPETARQDAENQTTDGEAVAADQAASSRQPSDVAGELTNPLTSDSSGASTNSAAITNSTVTQETSKAPPLASSTSFLSYRKPETKNKIAVIIHSDNPQMLSPREIRAMYMDKLTRWDDGKRVMLYNLPLGDKYREQFSKRILNMSALEADKLELERRENNLAINPMKVKAKNIIVSYVERHPNAIAYVPLSEISDRANVKVVLTISESE